MLPIVWLVVPRCANQTGAQPGAAGRLPTIPDLHRRAVSGVLLAVPVAGLPGDPHHRVQLTGPGADDDDIRDAECGDRDIRARRTEGRVIGSRAQIALVAVVIREELQCLMRHQRGLRRERCGQHFHARNRRIRGFLVATLRRKQERGVGRPRSPIDVDPPAVEAALKDRPIEVADQARADATAAARDRSRRRRRPSRLRTKTPCARLQLTVQGARP